MSTASIVLFIIGLALLIGGAEVLIRGASRLAAALGISPLVIGLTVVAFGTSSPELAVSVQSALSGQADIALGNVIGSNIFNILFILGLSALITPLAVSLQLLRLDVPLMIGISVLLYVFGLDGRISAFEGAVFVAGLIAYTVFLIYQSRKENKAVQDEFAEEFKADNGRTLLGLAKNISLIIAGLALLVAGSRWLVSGSIEIARYFGVSELVIGLTIVAAGTSLPEVATSVMAGIKGERDIAVGNVIGSNIFNILGVLGITGIAAGGIEVASVAMKFDIPVMIAVAFACAPVLFTRNMIERWEGAVLFGYYFAYAAYIILSAINHSAMPLYSSIMYLAVLPLTVIILAISTVRSFTSDRSTKK